MNTTPRFAVESCASSVASEKSSQTMPVRVMKGAERIWSSFMKGRPVGILTIIAVLSIVTGLGFFFRFQDFYTQDSYSYIIPAANLLAGHGFTDVGGNPETVRTPGYPVFILAILWCKLNLKYMIMLQHMFRVLLIVCTSAFAFHVTANRRQTFVTGLFLCFDLPLLEAANSVMAEILFTLILMAAVWLLSMEPERPRPLVASLASGTLAGMAVLIRPVALFFFIPAIVYLLIVRRQSRVRATLAFFAAFAVCPLLWATRNYIQTDGFTVSSIGGLNMLLYRAAGAVAIEDTGGFDRNFDIRQHQLEEEACGHLEKLYGKSCSELNDTQKAKYFETFGREVLMRHKAAYLKLALRGTAFMMLGGDATRLASLTTISPSRSRKILLLYSLPAFCLGLLGLLKLWKTNRSFFFLVFLVVSYFVVVSAGAEAYSRLRVPIEPLYSLVVAAGAEVILNRCLKSPLDVDGGTQAGTCGISE